MSLRRLPTIDDPELLAGDGDADFFPSEREIAEWHKRLGVRMAAPGEGKSIDIFGPVGKNPFTGEGTDSNDVSQFLKDANGAEVTVNINSPGGLYSQGAAIYAMLAAYPGKVTVNILGTSASAASVIQMAGDVIRISAAGAVMIHNSAGGVQGDRHDMEAGAAVLAGIDKVARMIYAARTGQKDTALDKMMTPTIGTWMFGQDAVDKGFADEMLSGDAVVEDKSQKARLEARPKVARVQLDTVLARAGFSRKDRRELVRDAFPGKIIMPIEQDVPSTVFSEIAQAIGAGYTPPKFDVTPRADETTLNAGHLSALDSVGRLVNKL